MKKFVLLFILFVFPISFFAEETFKNIQEKENISLDSELNENQLNTSDVKIENDSYRYWKVGSSLLLLNVGGGYKFRNNKKNKGNNLELNVYVPYVDLRVFAPTFKYSRLWYSLPQKHSSYFGLGFELGPTFRSAKLIGFLPNIEFFWGKERKKVKFTQIGINVGPFLGSALVAADSSDSKNWLSSYAVGLLVGSAVGISYCVGF